MSNLAKALPAAAAVTDRRRVRNGPAGACDVYGDGDLEDWAAIERRRLATTWATVQYEVDKIKKSKPIDEGKFRYHWRRKCWHWTPEQKSVRLEDMP